VFRLPLLLLAVTPVLAAPIPKDFRPSDAKTIVGKWHVESVNNDGTPHPAYQTNVYFEFGPAGQFAQTATGEKNVFRRVYTLDPTATPKRMTLLEPGSVAPQKWAYKVDGDTLLMGYLKGEAVPDAVGPAKGVLLYTLKRVKGEK
jgi:uncharacterized protein (TIGR03067 family)